MSNKADFTNDKYLAFVDHLRSSAAVKNVTNATNETIIPSKVFRNKQSFYEIPVIKKQQKNMVYYSGEMSISELAILTHVDNYDSHSGDEPGYQRNKTEKHGREFGYFIGELGNTCLGEIMLNDRDSKASFFSISDLHPTIPLSKMSANCGILRIPNNTKLYVYDGQTRRFGYIALLHFEMAMKAKGEEVNFHSIKVPFCIEQASYEVEVTQFVDHNNRQNRMSTSHKAMIVSHANISAGYENFHNLTAPEKVQVQIAGVARVLNDDPKSPWFNMINMPDTSDSSKIISNMASFMTGTKEMMSWMNRTYWSPEKNIIEKRNEMSEICITYWQAIKKLCPKIWKNPENYVMHKSQGIASLSILMNILFRDFYSNGIDWNVENIYNNIKRSNILTTPKDWEKSGKISLRGGNYKQLTKLAEDIFMQIRKNVT